VLALEPLLEDVGIGDELVAVVYDGVLKTYSVRQGAVKAWIKADFNEIVINILSKTNSQIFCPILFIDFLYFVVTIFGIDCENIPNWLLWMTIGCV
jgi:hypothetical protein